MKRSIFVALHLFVLSPILADQLVALNITDLKLVKASNSSEGEHKDVTICARFFEEPSNRTNLFAFGPITLRKDIGGKNAFGQMFGEFSYKMPTLSLYRHNSLRESFPIWPPGLWNHVCVSFSDGNCAVRVFLNGDKVVDTEMDPCYGLYKSGFEEQGNSMVGLVTDVDIWDRVISQEEAKSWTQCLRRREGNLVAWNTWSKNNLDVDKVMVDRNDICKKPGKILGFALIMHFDPILNFCRFLGGRIPTSSENQTMERINETLRDPLMKNLYPKWAFTGYVLNENEESANIYTG